MDRHFDVELNDLKDLIISMGGFVEKALHEATIAFLKRDPTKLKVVEEIEKQINQAHIAVDEKCLGLLARQAPLAKDLRFILATIKINTDLERMGDQAVNISWSTKNYLSHQPLQITLDLEKMSSEVRTMVRQALDAFVKKDLALAEYVLEQDDQVDEHKDRIFKVLVKYITQHPEETEAALDLILIARNLERMADHATNIAEDVIFATTGRDVRHGGKSTGSGGQ